MTYRKQLFILWGIVVLFSFIIVASAQDITPTPSDYVDLQFTEIRGLSEEQITGYRTGAGMGYALPAELNGYPGPRHVLDLVEELALTDEQLAEIQALFDEMLPQAIALGEQILTNEEALELAFRDGSITDEMLQSNLNISAELEAQLRYVHLRTHLATIDILTPHQVQQYNMLRGYDEPESGGHDAHGGHSGG